MDDKYKVSIIEYLGKIDLGILLMFSLIVESNYFESVYFYSPEFSQIILSDDLEEFIETNNVELDVDNINYFLESRTIPLEKAIIEIPDFELPSEEEITKLFLNIPEQSQVEEINPDQIKRLS